MTRLISRSTAEPTRANGPHAAIATANSANYAVFTLHRCHEHSNQTEVINNHKGVKGLRVQRHQLLLVPSQGERRMKFRAFWPAGLLVTMSRLC